LSDLLFKLRVLRFFIWNAVGEWKREIWSADLDAPYCCGGHECGCQASTTRELYGWHLEQGRRA
jgi:hypothetical protein